MSENPELTPAVLEELRTALLTRQAELQRRDRQSASERAGDGRSA